MKKYIFADGDDRKMWKSWNIQFLLPKISERLFLRHQLSSLELHTYVHTYVVYKYLPRHVRTNADITVLVEVGPHTSRCTSVGVQVMYQPTYVRMYVYMRTWIGWWPCLHAAHVNVALAGWASTLLDMCSSVFVCYVHVYMWAHALSLCRAVTSFPTWTSSTPSIAQVCFSA